MSHSVAEKIFFETVLRNLFHSAEVLRTTLPTLSINQQTVEYHARLIASGKFDGQKRMNEAIESGEERAKAYADTMVHPADAGR